jgi:hypothetical protein
MTTNGGIMMLPPVRSNIDMGCASKRQMLAKILKILLSRCCHASHNLNKYGFIVHQTAKSSQIQDSVWKGPIVSAERHRFNHVKPHATVKNGTRIIKAAVSSQNGLLSLNARAPVVVACKSEFVPSSRSLKVAMQNVGIWWRLGNVRGLLVRHQDHVR